MQSEAASAVPASIELEINLSCTVDELILAWTDDLDRWLAVPGTSYGRIEHRGAFSFELNTLDSPRVYGRVMSMIPGQIMEMTWVGKRTQGCETMLTVQFFSNDSGATLKMCHRGFDCEQMAIWNRAVWRERLDKLMDYLS